MLCPAIRRSLCVFATLVLFLSHSDAAVLDWNTVAWSDGSLNNSYQADPADPISGITIDVTANGGAPLVPWSGAPNPMTPTVARAFQGGQPTLENSLTLAVDLSNALTQSITVNMSFASAGGASDVSFQIFDIDAGGPYQDQLSQIHAVALDGSLIAPTITTSANNTLIGSGINQSVVGIATTADTGPNSGRANVTVSFGSNLIQSFTFTYGGTGAFPDPAYQHFGIGNINFTPIPEINPALLSVFSCLAAIGLVWRHRAQIRK